MHICTIIIDLVQTNVPKPVSTYFTHATIRARVPWASTIRARLPRVPGPSPIWCMIYPSEYEALKELSTGSPL